MAQEVSHTAKLKMSLPRLAHTAFSSVEIEALNCVAVHENIRHPGYIFDQEPARSSLGDYTKIFF